VLSQEMCKQLYISKEGLNLILANANGRKSRKLSIVCMAESSGYYGGVDRVKRLSWSL
jgi:hypothetical protein